MDKKDFRGQIETKLEASLAEFSKAVGEKKFKKHIKKASKLLAEGLTGTAAAEHGKPAEQPAAKPVKQDKAQKTAAKSAKAEKIEKIAVPPVKKAAKKAAAKNASKATKAVVKSKKVSVATEL